MHEIVVATANPHKVRELEAILVGLGITNARFRSLAEAGAGTVPPEETGAAFEENAAIKAAAYAAQTGALCLADDSGLEVDALAGAPGVISAYYATDGVPPDDERTGRAERDRANNERLLRELDGVPPEHRTARFVCVMALAKPSDCSGAGFQPAVSAPPPSEDPPSSISHEAPAMSSPGADNPAWSGQFRIRKRQLPHWEVANATYLITFRLAEGSLTADERQIVVDACQHWHGTRYLLHLVTVMPDHVHLLIRIVRQQDGSYPTLSKLMHSIKRHSAAKIQKLRGASGPLWQREYFDRILRTSAEINEKYEYMLNNPVRAGLCGKPGEYPFTARGGRLKTGPTSRNNNPSILATARGTFEGRIGLPGEVPRGTNGFGYDPLFLVAPGFEHTSAELDPDRKNALSHRARAVEQMAAHIRNLGPFRSVRPTRQ